MSHPLRGLSATFAGGLLGRTLILGILAMTWGAMTVCAEPGNPEPFKVLVFSKTLMFRHDSIPDGIAAIQKLGKESGFQVEATEDSCAFTAKNLSGFKALVFLSTTGDILDDAQQEALKQYLLDGGGMVGIHGAVSGPKATEEKWEWYGNLYCTDFVNHSAIVPASLSVEDAKHPSTGMLPKSWMRTDEWYNFTKSPRPQARVLINVDEKTYQGGTMPEDHPVCWCRDLGKGRLWYTAMGHTKESFAEPMFLQHVLGGIFWAAKQPWNPPAKPAHP